MALPWLIGGAAVLLGGIVAAALSDDDDKPSGNNNGDDEERRRREQAERQRIEDNKRDKRQGITKAVQTHVEETHAQASLVLKDWVKVGDVGGNLTISGNGSNLENLFNNSISFPTYPAFKTSDKRNLHLLQGISNSPLKVTQKWTDLSADLKAINTEIQALQQCIAALKI